MNFRRISGVAMMLFAGAIPVLADSVTYNFGDVSAGALPAGSPPWVQASFADSGANTVQLTLSAGGLTGSELVASWYFNLDPSLDPTSLTFTETGSTGSFTAPTVETGANGFKAGIDGKFDVYLGFNAGGDASDQFTGGDSVTFTITGAGINADDFNQLSTCASGGGQYASAAYIEAISDNDGSAWVNPEATVLGNNSDRQPAVPDASETAALLGTALIAMGIFARKTQIRPSSR